MTYLNKYLFNKLINKIYYINIYLILNYKIYFEYFLFNHNLV